MNLASTLIGLVSLCVAAQAFGDNKLATDADKALAVLSGNLHVAGLRKPVRVLRDSGVSLTSTRRTSTICSLRRA